MDLLLAIQLESQGYEVLNKEERQLTKEEAAEFYKQHEESVNIIIVCYLICSIGFSRNTLKN